MNYSQKANPDASNSENEAKIVIDHNKTDKKDLPYLYKEILKFEEWNRRNYL